MLRNKCFFFQLQISYFLRFTPICDLFTDTSSYNYKVLAKKNSRMQEFYCNSIN
jgi:hypothetical protein